MKPDVALKTLITLTDFATARWEEFALKSERKYNNRI